jgi:hypothetical protein
MLALAGWRVAHGRGQWWSASGVIPSPNSMTQNPSNRHGSEKLAVEWSIIVMLDQTPTQSGIAGRIGGVLGDTMTWPRPEAQPQLPITT